ncbi:MAG: hypothetical protein ABIU30_18475 [Ferruginibacter sp.]
MKALSLTDRQHNALCEAFDDITATGETFDTDCFYDGNLPSLDDAITQPFVNVRPGKPTL